MNTEKLAEEFERRLPPNANHYVSMETLDAAFREVFGREMVIGDYSDLEMWNSAWDSVKGEMK